MIMFQIYNQLENYDRLISADPSICTSSIKQALCYILACDPLLYDYHREVYRPDLQSLSPRVLLYIEGSYGAMINPDCQLLLRWALHQYDHVRFADVSHNQFLEMLSRNEDYALAVAGAKKILAGKYSADEATVEALWEERESKDFEGR